MELRHLRYFIAVAEAENVSRAALRLHVSQPALSRQIRDLEEDIGIELLERSAKSVKLTDAGRAFLDEARAVIQRAETAVANARSVADRAGGEIHVGYAPSLTAQILPKALRTFQGRFPKSRVLLHDLSTEEILTRLRDGELDVALGVRPSRGMLRGLDFEQLAEYPMCAAVAPGHALARSRKVNVSRIAAEPLIAYSRKDYPEYHEQIGALFDAVKSKPRIAEEHDSVTSLVAAVEAGCGVALVPSCLTCMVGPRLKLLALRPAPPPIIVGALWNKTSVTNLARQFIAAAGGKDTSGNPQPRPSGRVAQSHFR